MSRVRPPAVLPVWLWLWFPPILLAVIFPIRIIDPGFYRVWIDGELGVIELLTPVLAAIGAFYGVLLMRALREHGITLLFLWSFVMTAACIYFAGEELSWGQHLFGWSTPEYLEEINDQQENREKEKEGERKAQDGLGRPSFLSEGPDRIHKLIDIFKLTINRGKPDVGHRIEFLKGSHDLLTHGSARDFGLTKVLNTFFNPIHCRTQRPDTHGPFFASFL